MARTARSTVSIPLGSLTQPGARPDIRCEVCGSDRITHLAMTLTDGSPVEFVSCHRCEHRTWSQADARLEVERVLDKTRKPIQPG
jgi:DNA-directed RNA polymerase subunit M/transcription elongation factor TFIIS